MYNVFHNHAEIKRLTLFRIQARTFVERRYETIIIFINVAPIKGMKS